MGVKVRGVLPAPAEKFAGRAAGEAAAAVAAAAAWLKVSHPGGKTINPPAQRPPQSEEQIS